MNSKPIVLVDCDGVLSDFTSMYFDCIEPLLGRRPHKDEVTQWDVLKCFGLEHAEEQVDAFIVEKRLCLNMPEFEGAFDAVDELRKIADVHCVTAPYHTITWVNERTQWLQTRFGFSRDEIHFTKGKHICQGDVFIDDNVKNVRKYAQHRSTTKVFLWDRPWNRNGPILLPSNVVRTNNWDDVSNYVEFITKARNEGFIRVNKSTVLK